MDKSEFPRYKPMDVTADVTVTLPAHVWLGFAAAYNVAGWECSEVTAICLEAQAQMLDPVYLRERMAQLQQHRDLHERMNKQVFGGLFDTPPDDPRAG